MMNSRPYACNLDNGNAFHHQKRNRLFAMPALAKQFSFPRFFAIICLLAITVVPPDASAQSILPDVFVSCPVSEEPPPDFSIQERWVTAGTTTIAYQTPVVGRLIACAYDDVADDWNVLWLSNTRYDYGESRGGFSISVADVNLDGTPDVVILNGFDTHAFASLSPFLREEVLAQLPWPREAVWIGLAARYHPVKDHATFITAAYREEQA